MNPSNTPIEGQEAKNTTKETSQKNIYGLLKDGIEREFGNPMDPRKFDMYKKNKETNKEKIRTHMKDLRTENLEEWGSIDDMMIEREATNDTISEQILRMSQDLVFRRKRAFDRAIELFPAITEDDRNTLRREIADYNAEELNNFITRKTSMQKMVRKALPLLSLLSPSEYKDFEKIFGDRSAYFTGTNLVRLEKIFHEYSRFDQVPDKDDIIFILSGYSGSDTSTRKKEILTDLGVVLNMKDAYNFGLIDDHYLQKFSQTWFEELYNQLTVSAQASFVRGLSKNTSYVVPASEFSEKSLDTIFSNEKDRKRLAQEIFRSIALDMPEKDASKASTIVDKIRERKKKEAEAAHRDFEEEEYDLYSEAIEELKILQSSSAGRASPIKNIDLLKKDGSVVQFKHPNGSIQFVRIVLGRNPDGTPCENAEGTEFCVKLEGLNVTNNKLGVPQPFDASYDTFLAFLQGSQEVSVLTEKEFSERLTTSMAEVVEGSDMIFDARTIESEPITALNIASKLDMIDTEGSKYGFDIGTAFIAPIQDATGKKQSEGGIWTVKSIDKVNNTVDLIDPWGNNSETKLPLGQVYAVLLENSSSFKRITKIQDDAQMLNELKAFGVDGMKDGNLFIKSKDSHGHEIEKTITCFESQDGGHIRMESLQKDMVRIGEYGDMDLKKAEDYAQKNGIDTRVKGLYTWKQMSYSAFLQYLEKNKLKATKKDMIVREASHDLHGGGHGHHPHVHGSFMSRIFKMQNIASILKGIEMVGHGIEHTLEKGAKLDAAKFALSTAKFLNLPDSVAAQIYADVVDGSKEIVEKYEKKIFGLPGPRSRIKCLHIVENHDSRPEEVIAAMNFMLKSYGNLYGENMKHKQSYVKNKEHCITAPKGTFMFFDAFVITSNIGDLSFWRGKAYDKAIGEMGTEKDHEGEPTEEQLLHGLFKVMDGKWDQFPYAASVTKAIGGPGGFEKIWKFEGYDNAKKKGKDQTQMVSGQGRLNKAISYLDTHEIYKGIGAMEAVVGKDKSPKLQAFPFVWAVGGFSRYASHAALQDIKGYAERGYSFHAYSFLRKYDDNKVYKKVVRLALESKGGKELAAKFDSICARLEKNPDDYEHTDKAASDMMELWQKHCDGENGLHNMLQGHNGWLMKGVQSGDSDIRDYVETLEGKHMMQLDSPSISGDISTDYYNEWGYEQNHILSYNKETKLLSLRRMLNKINLKGTKTGDREMTDDDYKKLWGGVIGQMKLIRDIKSFSNEKEEKDATNDLVALALQKEQFRVFRKEIIDLYITKTNARTPLQDAAAIDHLLTLPNKYWGDIANMGIDPHAVFDPDIEKNCFEDDYERWKDGVPFNLGRVSSGGHVLDIASLVQQKTSEATARRPIPKPAAPTMRRTTSSGYGLHDEDSSQPGGAAYIAPDDAD